MGYSKATTRNSISLKIKIIGIDKEITINATEAIKIKNLKEKINKTLRENRIELTSLTIKKGIPLILSNKDQKDDEKTLCEFLNITPGYGANIKHLSADLIIQPIQKIPSLLKLSTNFFRKNLKDDNKNLVEEFIKILKMNIPIEIKENILHESLSNIRDQNRVLGILMNYEKENNISIDIDLINMKILKEIPKIKGQKSNYEIIEETVNQYQKSRKTIEEKNKPTQKIENCIKASLKM